MDFGIGKAMYRAKYFRERLSIAANDDPKGPVHVWLWLSGSTTPEGLRTMKYAPGDTAEDYLSALRDYSTAFAKKRKWPEHGSGEDEAGRAREPPLSRDSPPNGTAARSRRPGVQAARGSRTAGKRPGRMASRYGVRAHAAPPTGGETAGPDSRANSARLCGPSDGRGDGGETAHSLLHTEEPRRAVGEVGVEVVRVLPEGLTTV